MANPFRKNFDLSKNKIKTITVGLQLMLDTCLEIDDDQRKKAQKDPSIQMKNKKTKNRDLERALELLRQYVQDDETMEGGHWEDWNDARFLKTKRRSKRLLKEYGISVED